MQNNILRSFLTIHNEKIQLLRFIRSLGLRSNQKILDIGCGYGEKIKLLQAHGFHVQGVEVNTDIVKANRAAGLECMTVADFEMVDDLYDVLLMSHIIEHFSPDDLVRFIDKHLKRLKPGGYLIVATPLNSPYFYDDFDHVKPYHPTGLSMVFGGKAAQVQYYSGNVLKLQDIWFRKGPFRLVYCRGLYVHTWHKIPHLVNLFMILLFRASFGMIGRINGWMGVYRKV